MSTLTKLASIADYVDQHGQYDLASDITRLTKEAGVYDALRTLFDPEHTPGVDRNTPFWKRLSKGWARGKMDRNLGLVLAIMTELTKLNVKIDKLTAPVKDFQVEVAAFYDKLKGGHITSDNIREESRELQIRLKDTLKLISGKDLRQILKLKERLESQQQSAAEKIKGLDDETKANLMAILKGEELPGMVPRPEQGKEPNSGDTSTYAMRSWLRKFKIQHLPMYAGAETTAGKHQFREFMQEYGYHPKAITDYFMDNGPAQNEGFDRFPKAFGEILRRAHQIQVFENEVRAGRRKKEQVPGVTPKSEVQVPPAAAKEEKTDVSPLPAMPTTAPTNPHIETAKKIQEIAKERLARERGLKDIITPAAPPQQSKADDKLATTAAQRVERQITRLGRVQQLRKLAGEIEIEGPTDEDIEEADLFQNARDTLGIDPDPEADIYKAYPEGRKRLDEDTQADEDELEYYKGRDDTEDSFDERNELLRLQDEYISTLKHNNRGLTPEDDDWTPEPMHRTPHREKGREEQLEDVMTMLRLVDRRIDKMYTTPSREDYHYHDHMRLKDLEREKAKLLKMKAELSGLPEGWVND